MDLILLRHGETYDNNDGIYNRDDVSLTEQGIYQIERAADQIHNMIIDRALVSPLNRTKESFDIIRKYHDIPYKYDEEIVEIDAGKMKGLSFEQGLEKYPRTLEYYMEDYIHNPMPGGESIKEAFDRAGRVLRRLRSESGNVLLVTHGGFISLILAYILEEPKLYQRFSIDNGSFTVINMSNYPRIRYINRI